ncbi:MAG: hypothetical protein ABR499_10575 [Gemmatimonadaceae bacterium]
MGLTLEVGALASLLDEDAASAAAARLEAQFEAVNRALSAAGLPPHHEPRDLAPDKRWSGDMYGYSGVHYLRRIAAYVAAGRSLPRPGDDGASDDPVLGAYFAVVEGRAPSLFGRMLRRPHPARAFDHLIVHSDAEGFYLPLEFRDVLLPDEELEIDGGMIGSSPMLLRECERLATVLHIPPDVTPDSDELVDAAESQGEGKGYLRYGVEVFTCVQLREAARRSVETGAALVFS